MSLPKSFPVPEGLGLTHVASPKQAAFARRRDPATMPAFVLLAVAVMLGALVVLTETLALIVSISLLACVFVLMDFRFGVVCLILLMPLSSSTYFPHEMGGITGLNPMNLVLLGTLASCLMHVQSAKALAAIVPKQLIWLYVVPFVIAALIGSRHLHQIPSSIMTSNALEFHGATGYLLLTLIKPMMLVLFAVLVGAAVARSLRQSHFLAALLVSVCAMSLMALVFILASGAGLAQLATTHAREFLSPLGLHANDLGRLYAIAYALLLFIFVETKAYRLKLALFVSMALVVVALMLTFSRGAFFGFVIVNLWFLFTRRKLGALTLAFAFIATLALALPEAVFERIGLGFNASSNAANAISAGRLDGIWLPLLPEVWKSPLFGNGTGSILWSDAMRDGILPFGSAPGTVVTHPHNAYLRSLLDMGLLGLLLQCAYFVHVWRGLRGLSQACELSPEQRGFYAGASVGLISFLAAGLVGSSLSPVAEQVFLWLAIGMMYGQQYQLAQGARP